MGADLSKEASDHGFHLPPRPAFPVAQAKAYSDAALKASRGPWPHVQEHRDAVFEGGMPMDIFLPAFLSGPADTFVFFHGGGWVHGWKEWAGFMAPHVTARNMILVAPSYRLAPEFRYPASYEDALRAVAAIHRHLPEYGANTNRIIVSGHSAGGHLAAMIALRNRDRASFGAHGVVACATLSAILDLRHSNPPARSLEAMVYESVLADPKDDEMASPLTWLSDLEMPWFMSWGTRDTDRVRQSNDSASKRLSAHANCIVRTYNTDHFGSHLDLVDGGHDWYRALDDLRKKC